MKSLGYIRILESINTASTSPCIKTVGGADGTLFDIRGVWSLTCVMFKEIT